MESSMFLLADDDADDREMFQEAMEIIDSDSICHTVADGREVLRKLDTLKSAPELIFLDINMPLMNGWQCLEQLKAHERYKNIPVIIISTSSNQRDIDIARELQAVCFLTKPNTFKELTDILRVITTNAGPQLLPAIQALQASGSKYIRALPVNG